jgi:hypothetical protein
MSFLSLLQKLLLASTDNQSLVSTNKSHILYVIQKIINFLYRLLSTDTKDVFFISAIIMNRYQKLIFKNKKTLNLDLSSLSADLGLHLEPSPSSQRGHRRRSAPSLVVPPPCAMSPRCHPTTASSPRACSPPRMTSASYSLLPRAVMVTAPSRRLSSSSLHTVSWMRRGTMRDFLLSCATFPASSRTCIGWQGHNGIRN